MKVSVDSSNVNELELPQSPSAGDMNYWDGSAWVSVSAGSHGSTLRFCDNKPIWVPEIGANDVYNPATCKVWMDRNLGASQVADSLTDYNSYGDLYQWGRGSDGHQTIVWTSSTTSDESEQSRETTTLSMMDSVGHDDFITPSSPFDWRSPQNDTLWQGVSGINNPCPTGYRLPTEAEWLAETDSWISKDAEGAFASPLKLSKAGSRDVDNGSLENVGVIGEYWSSTVDSQQARRLGIGSSAPMGTRYRGAGRSVRCIKD